MAWKRPFEGSGWGLKYEEKKKRKCSNTNTAQTQITAKAANAKTVGRTRIKIANS